MPTQPQLRPIPTQEFADSCRTSIARAQAARRAPEHARFLRAAKEDAAAVFAESRAPFALETSIRIRSVPGNGLAVVTASRKHRWSLRMTTAKPCRCIVRNPERRSSAHGGKSMQRSWVIVAAMAASVAACGPSTSQQPAPSATAKSAPAPSGDGVAPGDWPLINRTLSADRYSPLTDINAGNVRNLETSWTFQLGGNSSAVPIVVGGIMFVPSRDRVVALDGDTGATVWTYVLPSSAPPSGSAPRPAAGARGPGRSRRAGRPGGGPTARRAA